MKIVKVEDLHALAGWRPISFLKMTTDEGLVGWAEYNDTYGADGAMSALIHKFGGLIVGMDPRDVGLISSSLHALTRIVSGGAYHQAIAALENACLDIKGKALGVPVYALFGGALRKRIPVYWSHCGFLRARHADLFESWGRFRVETLDDLKRLGADAVKQGYKAVKINYIPHENGRLRLRGSAFALGPHLLERNPSNAMLRGIADELAAFREGLGPDAGLMIDINFGQRTEGLLRIVREVEPYNLTWVEVDIHDPEALALVRRESPAPIASLESIHGLRGYRAYFENNAVDVGIIDVLWNGAWESYRIAALADAYEVNVAPHNYSGHLASLISAHVCAAVPNFRIMEFEADDAPYMGDLFTHPCVIENGELVLSDRPGWGTDINEEAVRAHPVKGPRMSEASFDYIIVGAGSAGCVLANRLTEDKDVRVLLLEAGRRDSHPWLKMPLAFVKMSRHKRYIWEFETEPEPALHGRRIPFRRGKTFGGTSSINGMIYARGHRRDFDLLRQRGLAGWSYADVLPYFKRLESSWRGESEYHGGDGPVQVTQVRDDPRLLYEPMEQAAVNYGLPLRDDYNGADNEGVSRLETFIGKGVRQGSARAYLHPALSRPNLSVETGAMTTRLVVERDRAVGLDYVQDGKTVRVRAEREVILSGGAYNSPQLLMLSGIGPADHLKEHGIAVVQDLPGVGENLREHPLMLHNYLARGSDTFLQHLRLDRATLSVARWHMLKTGPFASNGTTGVIYCKSQPHLERSDLQLVFASIESGSGLWFPGIGKRPVHHFSTRIGILYPDSRGWMKLRSADPFAKPRILFNLFKERSDIDTMIRAIRISRDIYNTPPHKELLGPEILPGEQYQSDAELEEAIRKFGNNRQHPIGTCAMGVGPDAVVDAELRVHGVAGLRVVDASVMPEEPGGNTHIPTVMIAEKASDMIRGRSLPPADV